MQQNGSLIVAFLYSKLKYTTRARKENLGIKCKSPLWSCIIQTWIYIYEGQVPSMSKWAIADGFSHLPLVQKCYYTSYIVVCRNADALPWEVGCGNFKLRCSFFSEKFTKWDSNMIPGMPESEFCSRSKSNAFDIDLCNEAEKEQNC